MPRGGIRAGAGRPRTLSEEERATEKVSVRFSKGLLEAVDARRLVSGLGRGAQVNQLCREALGLGTTAPTAPGGSQGGPGTGRDD